MIDTTVPDQKEIHAGSPILAAALRYLAAGLCPLPTPLVGDDQELKRPDKRRLRTWKQHKSFRPQEHYVRRWFAGSPQGICLVTGKVSGDLKVLDFDDHGGNLGDTFQRWAEIVRGQSPDMYDRLYVGQTPGGGYRVAFRCEAATGYKTRLAMAAKDDCLIELLDDGHVVMVPGGDPMAHPSGRPYTTVQGDLLDLPVLSAAEQQVLVRAARQLNRWTKPEEPVVVRPVRPVPDLDEEHQGGRPGDQFNAEADWEDILTPHGWSLSHHVGEIDHWVRPGKDPTEGASATTNYAGSNLLYCFSANAHPFEPDRSYTPFAAFAMLNHGGDFAAAAGQLADPYAEQQWSGDPAPGSPAARIRAVGGRDSNEDEEADQTPPEGEQPEQSLGPRAFRLDELDRLPPPRWLVRRHLTTGSLGCLYGPSGGGKSFVAIELAMAVSCGRPFLGSYDVLQGPVLYLSGEGTAGIGLRFAAWLRHHRQERPDDLRVVPYQFDLLNPAGVESLLGVIGRDLDRPPVLTVIDTVNRYFGGGDENNTRDMTAFVRGVDEIRHRTGGAVLLVHHSGKDPQKGERGSSVLRAAGDTLILCDRTTTFPGSIIECVKQKDAPEFAKYVVRRKVVDLGPDADGEPRTSCVLEQQDQERTSFMLLAAKEKEQVRKLWDAFGANPFGSNKAARVLDLSSSGGNAKLRRWADRGVLDQHEEGYRLSTGSRQGVLADAR